MRYEDLVAISDPLEAMKAMLKEMTDLRDEISSCKSDIARLNRNNTKLNVENSKLRQQSMAKDKRISDLLRQIEKLGGKVVEKDSTNSSIPPTQQSISKQTAMRTRSLRTSSGKTSGGQKGHEGHTMLKTDEPDHVTDHKVKVCPHCGQVIPDDAEQVLTRSVQLIDITGPMSLPEITEHNEYSVICPHCEKTAKGDMPNAKCTTITYGPKLQTMVVYLSVVQSVPYNRISEIMRDIFMVDHFSDGSVKNILTKNKFKATPVYDSILRFIEMQKAAGMDETGTYINKQLCWFWCLQCPKYCYVFADKSRGIKALEDHGILPHLEGLILYTDRHGTYFKLEVKGHQVCLVHLLRNLQYLTDLNPNQQWSSEIQQILRDAIHESKTKPLDEIDKESFRKRIHDKLEEDLSIYESDFQTLQNGLINCEDYLFTFLDNQDVPHHNNSSEASIRVLKVKGKVSGGFRTQEGADEFACFHSIAETAKRNGISKFNALYQLISRVAPNADFFAGIITQED